MKSEKQLQIIEEELKLLKGKLKQTLSFVRDYLLNMELPTTEFSTILAAPGDSSDQTVNMKGPFSLPPEVMHQEEETKPIDKVGEEPESEPLESETEPKAEKDSSKAAEEDEPYTPADDELETVDEDMKSVEEPEKEEIFEEEDPFMPAPEPLLGGEQQTDYERISDELSKSVPKVNLLANLITWISIVKKEIGDEQLPTFLEVYGISGHLSPELKDVILHLAEISEEKPGDNSMAEVWSNAMLSLHGILTGGDASLNPVRLHWNEIDEEPELNENGVIDIQKEPE